MFPDGVFRKPCLRAFEGVVPGDVGGAICFHGPAASRLPFQLQSRACVPPLGRHRGSPARRTAVVSRIADATATSGGTRYDGWSRTSFHAPSTNANTAQFWIGQQGGAAIVTAIA